MAKRIILSEGESRVITVNYDLDHEVLMKSAGIIKSVREKTLPIVKYHRPGLTGEIKVEIRDVVFDQGVSFDTAVRRIRHHDSSSKWQPVGIFEFLPYLHEFPHVYTKGNHMIYALGHIYDVDGHDHVLSATNNRGHLDFEALHFVRDSNHFSSSSVFPEFRILR